MKKPETVTSKLLSSQLGYSEKKLALRLRYMTIPSERIARWTVNWN